MSVSRRGADADRCFLLCCIAASLCVCLIAFVTARQSCELDSRVSSIKWLWCLGCWRWCGRAWHRRWCCRGRLRREVWRRCSERGQRVVNGSSMLWLVDLEIQVTRHRPLGAAMSDLDIKPPGQVASIDLPLTVVQRRKHVLATGVSIVERDSSTSQLGLCSG